MRTCLKNSHENRKNAKMNSSTQKCFTAEIVWKIIFEHFFKKRLFLQPFTLKSPNKKMFSIEIVWKVVKIKTEKIVKIKKGGFLDMLSFFKLFKSKTRFL